MQLAVSYRYAHVERRLAWPCVFGVDAGELSLLLLSRYGRLRVRTERVGRNLLVVPSPTLGGACANVPVANALQRFS